MWRVMSRMLVGVVVAGLVAGCATGSGSEGDREASGEAAENGDEESVDCVINDPEGSEVEIRQCYVETGPEGVARQVRIPIVETTTKTSAGEFTYPLRFEMEVTDKGKLRLIGPLRRSEGGDDDEDVPAETPSIDETDEGDEEDEETDDEDSEGAQEGADVDESSS